jgi:Glutathione S-transferase, C-terminal domain
VYCADRLRGKARRLSSHPRHAAFPGGERNSPPRQNSERCGTAISNCSVKSDCHLCRPRIPRAKAIPRRCEAVRHEQWVSVTNTGIFSAFVAYLWSHYFPNRADGQPDRVAIEKVLPEVEAHIALLNKAVADTGHLAGSSFTYTDMNLLPILAYLRECPERGDMLANAKALARSLTSTAGGRASRQRFRRRSANCGPER